MTMIRSQLLPVLVLLILQLAAIAEQQEQRAITLADCPEKCGNVSIPYPFGMNKPGCFLPGFEVTCNTSFHPPRAFLQYSTGGDTRTSLHERGIERGGNSSIGDYSMWQVELLDVAAGKSEARAYGAVRSQCFTNHNSSKSILESTKLSETFLLSATRNVLVGVGWNVDAIITQSLLLPFDDYKISCSGLDFCQASLVGANELTWFGVRLSAPYDLNGRWETTPCSYGMLVDKSFYNFSRADLSGYLALSNKFPRGVPFVIDFAIRNGSCPAKGQQPPPGYACVSGNSSCANATSGEGYVCKCWEHYDGNPYIPNGCQDIDECMLPEQYRCSSDGTCKNRLDGYDCPCKSGMKGDGKADTCVEKLPVAAKAAVGATAGILVLAFLSFIFILRNEKRKTKEFYRKNGGPTLEKAKLIKLFKKEELKPVLKASNLIGKGGFGEVYKGRVDNALVAVKKPIGGNVLENEQFANEVIIQSQVIHKNIVRLIGCCLEVDTPMLVYEFLPKGSLDDILHSDSKVPLNLNLRLSIAAESSHGLAYMHSQAHTKILHGDVKPANILLDDNFVPKISDFGISKLIARDKEHATSVIGDMTYMDPVYMQTGLLTEKSDVYSFGVVILELISRKKATHSDNNSLVRNFLEDHKKGKKATELFDKEIAATDDLELLDSLAGIAVECLHLDVDERPSMTDVAERLLILNRSRKF